MAALDPRHIHESGAAADQCAARKHQLWDRLQTTLSQRASAVTDALAALEKGSDFRMVLHPLHLVERRNERIGIIEMDDETYGTEILAPVIHEEAAAG